MTITVYFLKKEEMDVTFPLDGHKMLSVMVAYLVVSRADASYNRFWEARGLLLLALQTIRQISIHAAAFTNGDLQRQEGKARDRTNLCASCCGNIWFIWFTHPFVLLKKK